MSGAAQVLAPQSERLPAFRQAAVVQAAVSLSLAGSARFALGARLRRGGGAADATRLLRNLVAAFRKL
jgi:hypothetical protein